MINLRKTNVKRNCENQSMFTKSNESQTLQLLSARKTVKKKSWLYTLVTKSNKPKISRRLYRIQTTYVIFDEICWNIYNKSILTFPTPYYYVCHVFVYVFVYLMKTEAYTYSLPFGWIIYSYRSTCVSRWFNEF